MTDKGSTGAARGSLIERLAEECRRLADECEQGTAPPLITDDYGRDGKHCALGCVLSRAGDGAPPWRVWHALSQEGYGQPAAWRERARAASGVVRQANNNASDEERHRAIVGPLRALAAAMEAP